MTKITTEEILSKLKQYQVELFFLSIILIIAALAKTFFNIILDYRVLIILMFILWYLGYLNNFQEKVKTNFYKLFK